jgi:hypothetical protein
VVLAAVAGGPHAYGGAGSHDPRLRRRDELVELVGREAPVQWGQHGTGLGGGEEQLEEVDAVAADEGDAVAWPETEAGQRHGDPAAGPVELGEGYRSPRIGDGRLGRPKPNLLAQDAGRAERAL